MSRLKKLAGVSLVLWNLAIFLTLFRWLQIWSFSFKISQYIIKDGFIYVGVLGGWMFLLIIYIGIILFVGKIVSNFINFLVKDKEESKRK